MERGERGGVKVEDGEREGRERGDRVSYNQMMHALWS